MTTVPWARVRGTAAVILVFVLSAAGCSDDGPHLSRTEFVRRATPLCQATRDSIEAAAADLDLADPDALPKFIEFASGEVLDQIDDLRSLGVPKDGGDDVNEALDELEEQFRAWQKNPANVLAAGSAVPTSDAGKVLSDYGLSVCDVQRSVLGD